MGLNTNPVFTSTPRVQGAILSAGHVDMDGANTTLLFTTGANGSKIKRVEMRPTVTTGSDFAIRFFLKNGTDYFLVKEVIQKAHTVATGTQVPDLNPDTGLPQTYWLPDDLFLPSGTDLYVIVSVTIADVMVVAYGADLDAIS